MSNSNTVVGLHRKRAFINKPDNPREDMEPSDMSPDDARKFFEDLLFGINSRAREVPDSEFNFPDNNRTLPQMERAKQHYGNEKWQLLAGIEAAIREWDESGQGIRDLKDKYSGRFIDGVEIGERLAVYQGSDFTFSAGENETDDSDSKFTFST